MVTPAPPPAGHGRRHDPRPGSGAPDPIPGLADALPLTGGNKDDYVHPQSNTTLADVPGLKVSLAASSVYQVTISIMYNSGSTPNFKWQINPPSGATGAMWARYFVIGSYVSFNSFIDSLTAVASDGTGVGYVNAQHIRLDGMCITTAGGDLQIQAAQNTSDPSDTTVMKGSSIVAVKIA